MEGGGKGLGKNGETDVREASTHTFSPAQPYLTHSPVWALSQDFFALAHKVHAHYLFRIQDN